MKRLLMSVAVMCVYGIMAFASQQEQNTQSGECKSASTSMSTGAADTNANTNRASTKAQAKEQKKNRRKPQKEDNRTQQEKDFDRTLLGIYGG